MPKNLTNQTSLKVSKSMFLDTGDINNLPLKEKFFVGALLLVCGTMPFNAVAINSVSIILLVVAWALNSGFKWSLRDWRSNQLLIAFSFFYFLHLLFMLTTTNTKTGFFELEKK